MVNVYLVCIWYSVYDVGQLADWAESHTKSVSFELIKVIDVSHFPSAQYVSQATFYAITLFNSYFALILSLI